MNTHKLQRQFLAFIGIIAIIVNSFLSPTAVTIASIPGSLQSELGCPGDWQPECANTQLAYDGNDDVWQAVFAVPAGGWEYKAAVNNAWDENYGLHAQPGGANIALALGADASVK